MADLEKLIAELVEANQMARYTDHIVKFSNEFLDEILLPTLRSFLPKPPRIISLDEAVRGDDLSWIEINVGGGPRNFGHWTDCYRDPNGENYVISAWAGGNNWLDPEQYGRTWRCWSQRPSEEERKAVPWEA